MLYLVSAACGKFIKAVEDNWHSDRLGSTGIECNTHVAKKSFTIPMQLGTCDYYRDNLP